MKVITDKTRRVEAGSPLTEAKWEAGKYRDNFRVTTWITGEEKELDSTTIKNILTKGLRQLGFKVAKVIVKGQQE